MDKKLTPKRDKFCRLIAEGKEQLEAYDLAGFSKNQKPATRSNNAYMLMQNSDIIAKIDFYKKQFTEPLDLASQITVERQLKYCQKAIQECLKNGDFANYFKGLEMQNKLLGLNAPTKTDNSHTLKDINSLNIEIK